MASSERSERLARWVVGAGVVSSLLLSVLGQTARAEQAVPELARWESQMVQAGRTHCERGAWDDVYPDAQRVYEQIADYTGDPSWRACAERAGAHYRDQQVLPTQGRLPGDRTFTTGLRMAYERTGEARWKTAVGLLSREAAYTDERPLEWTRSADLSEEVAYAILGYIDAERVGEPRRQRRRDLVDQAYDHLDQWFGRLAWPGRWQQSPAETDRLVPFKVGLTAHALIRDWEETRDPRLLPALRRAADWLWANAWVASDEAMWYESGHPGGGAADVNLLIAPLYAFLYGQTGETTYREQGDAIFGGGVRRAGLGGGEQFAQNYWWSVEYVKWRRGPADTSPPTVSLTSPTDGSTVSGSAIAVAARAADDVGVVKVEFTVDGATLEPAVTAAPYAINWDTRTVGNGSHVLVAKAYDAAGNVGSSTPVTVTVADADVTPPRVALVSPTAGQTVSGSVTVRATATDEVGVTRLDYLLDGRLLAVFAPPVSTYVWDSTTAGPGEHRLSVRAWDAAGNTGSSAVLVTVANDSRPATVATGTVTASASAAASAGVVAAPVLATTAGTTAGALRSYSTIYSIGLEWDIAGDPEHNASVQVAYRVQGASGWKPALPLVRIDYNGFNMLAGSILFLSPNTTYEVQLQLSDPDGGADSRLVTVATRPVPSLPTGGRTFHVVPGAGGGDGSVANPFRGIAAAQAVALPGDIFLLHGGSYGGVTFTKAGAAGGNYIVWKGAGDGEATLGAITMAASHVWLEGLTVRNQSNGLTTSGAPQNVVISRNSFLDNFYSIHLNFGGSNWYIADNIIHGTTDPVSASFSGEGIELNNTSGHVVAHNSITWVADAISGPSTNVDIFGNDIFNTSDDGIEADSGRANVRIWGNRIQMAYSSGISFQPQDGAPWYIIRNQLVNFRNHVFKFRTVDRFVLLHNTLVNWGDISPCCGSWNQIVKGISKNNLWISVTGGQIWENDAVKDWRTDLDYEGFDWGVHPTPFTYGGVGYSSLTAFATASGLERQGIRVNHATCFETFNVPGPPPTVVPPQFMTLTAGCNAVDAGTILPNINDGFVGAAPDLGAYELGQSLPLYGPRPVTTEPPLPPPPPPAPALKVYRAGTPITMDGVLGEWGGAEAASFSGRSNTASASLLWDDANLYVAFQVTDSQLNALAVARDDANLWRDDSVEVYVDTRNDRASTMQPDDYQFLVNLRNVQGDLRGTGSGKDPVWNATWQSAVRLQGTLNTSGDTDSGYTVEIAIPWVQLGVTPVSGMVLGIELAVNDSDPGSAMVFDQLDWAGIAPNPYAQPSLWKQVELVGTLPPVTDTTPPSVAVTSPSSGATVSGTVTIAGTAADNVALSRVEVLLDGGAPQPASGTSAWTRALDTRSLSNGTHTIVARAVDTAGNTGTASVSVTVSNDITPPTVSIASPLGGAIVLGTITVTAVASDNVGVVGVQFKLDGANLGGEVTVAPYAVSWTTPTVVNGSHTLTAVARDAVGNSTTSAAVGITVNNPDIAPPTVSITSPLGGATVAQTITVSATASDNVAVAGVQFKLDGANLGAERTASPYAISWDSRTATNGAHSLTAVARDTSGNTATSGAVGVTVGNDITPPLISAVSVSNLSPSAATINWSTDEPSDTQVEYGVTAAYGSLVPLNASLVTAHSQTLTGLAAGTLYHYRVRSRDVAGNLAVSGDFTLTPPIPDLVVLRPPTPITIDGAVGDWTGATPVQFSGLSNSATAYLAWDATNLYVAFKVTDTELSALQTTRDSGNLWQDDSVEVYIDTLGDRASAMQPDDYQFLVNLNNVQVDLRGTGSGKDVTWNGTWASAVKLAGTLNSHGDADGGYVVEMAIPWAQLGVTPAAGMYFGLDLAVNDSDPASATTFDQFDWARIPIAPGSWAQPRLWKWIQLGDTVPLPDTTPPSVAIASPASGATVSGTSTIAGTAADTRELSRVEVVVDGGAPQPASGTSSWSLALNTLTLSNGPHTIVARAVDAAGNVGTASVSVTVSNDITPPAVSVTSPLGGATVSGLVTIAATASDDVGVVGVQFQVDGVNVGAEDTVAPYSVAWDATTAAVGTHTITAVARDAAGKLSTSAEVAVTVPDTTPPAVSVTSPVTGATVAGLVTVSASAADNLGIVGVQFKLDGVDLGVEDTVAPYAVSWDTTTAVNGSHTLTAVARDAAGNLATSAPVVVTVKRQPRPDNN